MDAPFSAEHTAYTIVLYYVLPCNYIGRNAGCAFNDTKHTVTPSNVKQKKLFVCIYNAKHDIHVCVAIVWSIDQNCVIDAVLSIIAGG